MSNLIERHRRACDGFARVAGAVPSEKWDRPTPCSDWDARALVEHVIGFHDFLLLRPLGMRAERPRDDPAARWAATAAALFTALAEPGVLDRATELPGGGQSTPGKMLGALTTDVLVHTWDLARAVDLPPDLDLQLCASAVDALLANDLPRDNGMFEPAVAVAGDADAATRLIAFYGRDPDWRAS
jgi:uncharacterized protein (TIGR03086 family)